MDLNRELGVKGFCFRTYKDDNAVVAEKVKAIGVDRIDLSRPQCDFRQAQLHEACIAAYRDAGVTIVGIGVVPLHGDELDRQYFEFCRKAGCRTISISGDPATFFDALRHAERLADEYDMRLAIHNHGGKDWLGSARMLQHVLSTAGPRVGLCVDTAWAIHSGEDPIQWVEAFAGRIFATHLKDFVFARNGKVEDVIVGTGALDLPAYVAALQRTGFEGPAVIEYEADVDNPTPKLTQCVETMRRLLAGAAAMA